MRNSPYHANGFACGIACGRDRAGRGREYSGRCVDVWRAQRTQSAALAQRRGPQEARVRASVCVCVGAASTSLRTFGKHARRPTTGMYVKARSISSMAMVVAPSSEEDSNDERTEAR